MKRRAPEGTGGKRLSRKSPPLSTPPTRGTGGRWGVTPPLCPSAPSSRLPTLPTLTPLSPSVAPPPGAGDELKQAVAAKLGWAPVKGLLRLDGFEEPWELLMWKVGEGPSQGPIGSLRGLRDALLRSRMSSMLISG